MGRGGQAALVVVASRVFGSVLKVLMRSGEVGYDLFSAVAFEAGSARSLVTIGRHVLGATPVPRTRRAVLAYVGYGGGDAVDCCFAEFVGGHDGVYVVLRPDYGFRGGCRRFSCAFDGLWGVDCAGLGPDGSSWEYRAVLVYADYEDQFSARLWGCVY